MDIEKRKNVKENVKTYVTLYIMILPFAYLVSELGDIHEIEWPLLNIFLALSCWLYIKKIRPLICADSGIIKANIFLFFLIGTLTLLSVKTVSQISTLDSEISSLTHAVSSLETDVSNIENTVSNIENTVSTIEDDVSGLKYR